MGTLKTKSNLFTSDPWWPITHRTPCTCCVSGHVMMTSWASCCTNTFIFKQLLLTGWRSSVWAWPWKGRQLWNIQVQSWNIPARAIDPQNETMSRLQPFCHRQCNQDFLVESEGSDGFRLVIAIHHICPVTPKCSTDDPLSPLTAASLQSPISPVSMNLWWTEAAS